MHLAPVRRCAFKVKQPLRLRHASSPPLFAARGRRRASHSRPLARGRAERRVPVAALGLMRMRSSAKLVHQDFRRRRASARRSAYGVFSACLHFALANGPITKMMVPRRRDREPQASKPDAFQVGRPSHCPGGLSIPRSAISLPVAVLAQIRPARRQTSPPNRVTPHLRRPPHPTPRT